MPSVRQPALRGFLSEKAFAMTEQTTTVSVSRVRENERFSETDTVVVEYPFTIILNDNELTTTLCTPDKLEQLAIGFLVSEGIIKRKEEIEGIRLNPKRGSVRITTVDKPSLDTDTVFRRFITSGCGKGTMLYSFADALNQTRIESDLAVKSGHIYHLMKTFQDLSGIFKETGGVHSAALADNQDIIVFSEDIGRHNAVDKVFGQCLMEEISTQEGIFLTSGRVSSEILFKTAKRNVPVLVSRSAPTDLAIKSASELGITLIGFVRGKRMNIYTNEWRITD
jgi:FdhD protein